MTTRATIVASFPPDRIGRRYGAAVVLGTVDQYYPAAYSIRRWTAAGARRAGDRQIARLERREAARYRRERRARAATYEQESA